MRDFNELARVTLRYHTNITFTAKSSALGKVSDVNHMAGNEHPAQVQTPW